MDSRKIVFKETAVILAGLAVCVPVMLLVFWLLGYYDTSVLLGGIAGALIALLNFFFMAMSTCIAADKAEKQDVKGGQATIQTSYILRQLLLFGALIVCGKSGVMNLFSLVIPVLLVRPIITVAEFFRKKGGKQS